MTVPVQRGASNEDPTVLSMILGAVEDVKTSMAHVTTKIDSLDQKFMPRAEYEARHSDVRQLITEARAQIAAEVTARQTAIDTEATAREALEDKLTQGRRWSVIATFTAIGAVVGVLGLIITIITVLAQLR